MPGKSILLNSAWLNCVNLLNSSPLAPRFRASAMTVAIRMSCSFSRNTISSVSPFSSVTKGWVQGSPMGKLNFSFCCELRSKWSKCSAKVEVVEIGPWVYGQHVGKQ